MAEYICVNGVLRPINHIYQCVDRLIEGVDYERWDWLKRPIYNKCRIIIPNFNDSKVYISTKIRDEFKGRNTKKDEFGGDEERMIYVGGIRTAIYAAGNYLGWKIMVCSNDFDNTKYISNNYRDIECDMIGLSTDFVRLTRYDGTILDNWSPRNFDSTLIDRNVDLNLFSDGNWYARCSINYLKLVSRLDGTIKLSLSPCKLIRPISASLDSQGIARQIGECGMTDGIKFYGNANTTGSFSVYND